MKNEELKKRIYRWKDWNKLYISWWLLSSQLNLEQEEKITLNKYGRMRLNYLKEYKKVEFSIMFMNMTLNKHLTEVQETAQARVNELVEQLKARSDLTEDMKNTDPLYWVGTMNAIKGQAEAIVLKELIFV